MDISEHTSTIMAQPKVTSAPQVMDRRLYRSALAISNVGVRLLERQCYGQAVESLSHASALMKAILFEAIDADSAQRPSNRPHFEGGEDLVQRSMLSLANLKPSKKRAMYMDVLTAMEDGSIVSGQVPETHPSSVAESVLQASPSSCVAFPIRIQDNLLLEMKGDLTFCSALSVQAAMIWHNLGIAYLCHSQTCAKSSRRPKLRKRGLSYLASAHSVLETNYAVHFGADEESVMPTDSRARCLPCLMMAVLVSYIYLLHASDQDKRAVVLYANLNRCRFAMCSMESLSTARSGALRVNAPAA